MVNLPIKCKISCINVIKTGIISLILCAFICVPAFANIINEVISFASQKIDNKIDVHISCKSSFVSAIYELPNPKRIIVDIADVKISKTFNVPSDFPGKISYSEVNGSNPNITRFEIFMDNIVSFNSSNKESDLLLSIIVNENEISSTENIIFNGIKVDKINNKTLVHINTNKKISKYSVDPVNKDGNNRLDITIDSIQSQVNQYKNIEVNTSLKNIITEKKGNGLLIALYPSKNEMLKYTINDSDSGITISLPDGEQQRSISKMLSGKNSISTQLPDINPLDQKPARQSREQQMQDAFNFSGYNKERITVEFQKMDLHNVFNFLRQVSGVNIVVDESVQGALTLVLDDVPWDFALDIILNLKELEKEERFNTIVIYPKGKGFRWPEQAENNLSFEADSSVIAKETLIVQQQDKQSPEMVEAKDIIAKAIAAERAENYESAVVLYEQAFDKWPSNVNISNRISSLYLNYLRQNAKSLFFAQRTLSVDKGNQVALLNAGIASANMENTQLAEQYFSQSIQGKNSSKEGFLNYAALKESKKDYRGSLSILSQHDQKFGKSLESMVASARINDVLGAYALANNQYREILNSGYSIPPDLAKYIRERLER